MNKIPDKGFIFSIGAQKAGTTTLHNLLQNIELISLPKIKETHFFSNDENYSKGFEWYLQHFDLKKDIFFEVDPSYLFFKSCASRIKDNIQSPKFIIIFRKPIERALSQYFMSCYRGYESLSFIDAIQSEKDRLDNDTDNFSLIHHSYLKRGNYNSQLEKYLKHFDRENFMFIKFEDFISDDTSTDTLKKIIDFINLSSDLDKIILPKSNVKKRVKSTVIRDLLYKESLLSRAAKAIIRSDSMRNNLKVFINHFNSSNFTKSESKNLVDKQLESIPNEYLIWNNKQTKMIMRTTGLDLNDWIY